MMESFSSFKACDVEGELLSLLKNYLENLEQRAALIVKHLSGENNVWSSTRISTGNVLVFNIHK